MYYSFHCRNDKWNNANYEKINRMNIIKQNRIRKNMIDNLISQEYERLNAKTSEELYANLKIQIED